MLIVIALILLLNPVSSFASVQLGPERPIGYPDTSVGLIQDELCLIPTSSSNGFSYTSGRLTTTYDAGYDNQCIVVLDTLATAGNISYFATSFGFRYVLSTSAIFPLKIEGIMRAPIFDTDTRIRFGIGNTATGDPSRGVYFEKDTTETTWRCVTIHTGVSTRTDTGLTPNPSNYIRYRMEIYPTIVYFFIDNTLTCAHTTNIGNDYAGAVFFYIRTNVASSKTLNVDYLRVQWRQNR